MEKELFGKVLKDSSIAVDYFDKNIEVSILFY